MPPDDDDPRAEPPPPTDAERKLLAAALAYAHARAASRGRALKIAQAREAFDHAVDEFLSAAKPST